jgi:hypothetical protein
LHVTKILRKGILLERKKYNILGSAYQKGNFESGPSGSLIPIETEWINVLHILRLEIFDEKYVYLAWIKEISNRNIFGNETGRKKRKKTLP